jgi:DNA-binding MarR family transcriptional regulator
MAYNKNRQSLSRRAVQDSDPNNQLVIPPQHVQEAIRSRLSAPRAQRLETVFLLRSTAQQVENAASEWLGSTTGSPARFQTMILLWAAGERPTPHQEIIALLRVKRATVSALMFGLEQDGLVQSMPDPQDRRRQLATLTAKGRQVIGDAMDLNANRLEQVMGDFSAEELDLLQRMLRRLREDFGRALEEEKRARRVP